MDTKLTVKLDEYVIEQAKIYAKKKNTSLSNLIETYLGFLIEPKTDNVVTPLVQSLSGIINPSRGDASKKIYKSYLLKKYTK